MKIIVAITGASGSIYAKQLIDCLCRQECVTEVAVIFSRNGREVAQFEEQMPDLKEYAGKVTEYSNENMFAAPASGSAGYDAMVVVPCSMGTAGRVASGVSADLISRAADVMLKERRKLIMVVRESPYSTVHLRNMTALSECGAVILPASPSFYSKPSDISQLCMTITERVVSQLGIDMPHYQWG